MNRPKSLPWSEATDAELSQVHGVCLDIDETLSTRGKITAPAFTALWGLKEAGYLVVPVTGRPAGWCDHIARFWPVDAVVGENGAFTFYMKDGVRRRHDTPGTEAEPQKRLSALAEKVRARFPHAKWASDQSYREHDLAIDICEDVPPWPETEVEALLRLCETEGAHAKLSSVHVNAWFGDYDKRRGMESWLAETTPDLTEPRPCPRWEEWLFIGDSPNDEPMFASFRFSVGVANISRYLNRLSNPPTWLTREESGAGFAEMANRMIQLKNQKSSY